MKIKYNIGILCFTLFGLGACLDDQSSLGDRELSEITISAPHDTLTAYFGEEFVVVETGNVCFPNSTVIFSD